MQYEVKIRCFYCGAEHELKVTGSDIDVRESTTNVDVLYVRSSEGPGMPPFPSPADTSEAVDDNTDPTNGSVDDA